MKKLFAIFYQFLQKLIHRSSTPTTTDHAVSTEHENKISYSKDLIPALKNDHQRLIALYIQIDQLIQIQKFEDIQALLMHFKTEFNRHIMQENVSFYCYLEQNFAKDTNHLETVKQYRKEMNNISHSVVMFIKKWQSEAITSENLASFQHEFESIGQVLTQRIHSEEDQLYPLYQPAF
ncbi:hemerythrin domain-containing protein [Acinetobacter sp. Marseille-Q1618]|uniref:hemerythrin domain-containing protein n=1 Tax=Acinetobacter sp. Marseille-Q1618 TaxID=2697502 RepID=UPI001570E0E7|nr:hemerythrin domain-containing protein [Acinetobacter sp. Marseille-Q1618]